MARYQVVIAYDGTDFSGFQRQAKARTVQSVVETALKQVGWQGKSILAAGRTDTGVHASGQVIAFDLNWGHNPGDLQRALNASLPADIAVRAVMQVEDHFHPRYDARYRLYRYRIFCDDVRQPLYERYAWRVWPAVEFNLLEMAASLLPGKHDFAAFGTPPRTGGSTIRNVYHAGWKQEDEFLRFEITADAFLYRMVRRLVFWQVNAGQGKINPGELPCYLQGKEAPKVLGTAPAAGLTLVEVGYANGE